MNCNVCGKVINGQYFTDDKNNIYCSDNCVSSTLPKCYVCKKQMNNWQESEDGKKYCSDTCFSTSLPQCSVCNKRCNQWITDNNGAIFCSDECFAILLPNCCVCNKQMHNWQESTDGSKYCSEECYSTTLPKCKVCNKNMRSWIIVEKDNYCDENCLSKIFKYYRVNDVNSHLKKLGYGSVDVLLIGATGAGKSSTINSLTKDNTAEVGYGTEPKTMALGNYMLSNGIQIWDTPGLGDGIENDKQHIRKISNLLQTRISGKNSYGFIDIVVLVIEAGIRDMGTVFTLIDDVVLPNLKESSRLLIGLNQADVAMKGKGFNYDKNQPNTELLQFLEDKAMSVRRRIKESSKYDCNVVYYSAETGYNVTKFLDFIIDNIPLSKRYLG